MTRNRDRTWGQGPLTAILPACLLSICFAGPPAQTRAAAPAAGRTPTVSSPAALMKAISLAHPGGMILLAAGDYGALHLKDVKFAVPVTIASADPARPAIFRGLSISDSAGLRFEHLLIEVPSKGAGVVASDSSKLEFDHLTVHGDDAPRNGLGFMVRNVAGVRIENCDVSRLWGGINHLDDSQLVISGNRLHDLQEDAIRGGGSSDVLISDNYMTDIVPLPGDHPDAIQFWGTALHPEVQNIKITGNVFVRGAGRAAQGIFVADGAYRHVTVSKNAIVGGLFNGIVVSGAHDLTIEDNLVQGYTDNGSWIGVAESADVVVAGNESTGGIVRLKANTGMVERGTRPLKPGAPGDLSVLERWRAHP